MTETKPQPPQLNPYLPKKRTPLWMWAALGVIVAFAISAVIWAYPSVGPSSDTTHTVVYTAEADTAYGSGRSGSYTIQTDSGGTSQGTGLLPMSGTYTKFHAGDFVYVSVQNGQALGSVTCRITVDGVVLSENTSSGGYTIATCNGQVP